MTITRRPARPVATPQLAPKKTPESFIDQAQHPIIPEVTAEVDLPKLTKKGKEKEKNKDKSKDKPKDKDKVAKGKDKEAVLIRFEDEQLTMMDARAAALGLSRAAWLRMVVAKALMGKKH